MGTSRSNKSETSKVIIAIILVGGLIMGMGLLAFVTGIRELIDANASSNWPAVERTITRAEIKVTEQTRTKSTKREYSYEAEIEYEFSINKSPVKGDRIKYGEVTNKEIAERMVKKYPVGKQVKIYYDPSNPKKSVLEPGYSMGLLFLPLMGLVAMVAAILCGVAIWIFGTGISKEIQATSRFPFLVRGLAFGIGAVLVCVLAFYVMKEVRKKSHKMNFQDPTTSMHFVYVKGGCFDMGATAGKGDGDTGYEVCVDDFYMGKHEVTQYQWAVVMDTNPSKFNYGGGNPAEQVSWDDVQEFIKKLNKMSRKNYRLPTEAEWKYACREGGKEVRFGTGTDRIDSDLANFNAMDKGAYSDAGEYRRETVSSSFFEPNSLGLYNMSGNLSEWIGAADKEDDAHRIACGGSWADAPESLCCDSECASLSPSTREPHIGFRLVESAEQPAKEQARNRKQKGGRQK